MVWHTQLLAVTVAGMLFSLVAYSKLQQQPREPILLQRMVQATAATTVARQSGPTAMELQQLERGHQRWLASFQAADPAFQDYCLEVLVNSTKFPEKGGQHNQDIFLFQNLFKFWPQQGRKGFYVESGANDAYYLSTSMFYDKCLGWHGLCIEPQPKFHKALRANRSCTLVPECISAKKEVLSIAGADATAQVTAAGAAGSIKVNCTPLQDILERYAGSAQHRIDIWILDVEGFEMKILEATNFSSVNIDAVMVEDLLMLPKPDVLDIAMAKQGFLKFQELGLDSVFVRRGHPAAVSTQPIWLPPGFDDEVERKKKFVRSNLCGYWKQRWGS